MQRAAVRVGAVELAYYGSEDLTPSEFYRQKDAKEALEAAQYIVEIVKKNLKNG